MSTRMFVALRPPAEVRDHLAAFLDARPQLAWTPPEQWHLTLAFMAAVPDYRQDELVERLTDAFARKRAPLLTLLGAGAFPDPARARVLWLGARVLDGSLADLSVVARNAANVSGAAPDGRAFVPHVTLARLSRPIEATRWLRILDTFTSDPFEAQAAELIASHLGEGPGGRPRYEEIATFPLSN